MKNKNILSTIFVYALLALFSMLISLNAHAAVGQVSSYIDMGPHVPGGIKVYPRPNSDYVYTLSRFDNSIKLWNVSSRRHEKSVYLASHEGSGLIGLCDDGSELIVAQHVFPGKLRLYRVDREKMVEVDFHELPIDAQLLTCASDGEFNFVAGKNKLFSINKKSFATKELYVGSADIVSIDTSPTNQLAILENNGDISIFNGLSGSNIKSSAKTNVSFKSAKPANIKFSPDGSRVAVSSYGMGLKVFDSGNLSSKGSWESISAGYLNTSQLNIVAWRGGREIISAGNDEPIMRSINNRGELSGAIAKFETPAIGVSDMISIGNQVIAGTYRGNLIVLAGTGNLSNVFQSANQTELYDDISFSTNDDFLYRLTKRGSVVLDYRLEGNENRSNIYYKEFRRINKRVNGPFPSLVDCSSALKIGESEFYIKGYSSPEGAYAESSNGSKIKFEKRANGVNWSGCVEPSGQYVVLGGENVIQLYRGVSDLVWSVSSLSPVTSLSISPNKKFIGVLLGNNTIEFREFSSGRLLWTMISPSMEIGNSSSRDFILTISGGYTNAPVGFLDKLKYRVEVLGNKAITVSANEFFDVFYRPDLVNQMLLDGRAPVVSGISILKALEVPPPTIETQFKSEDFNSSRQIHVPYLIHDNGGGVAEVRVFQNGKLISSDGTYKDALGKAYAPLAGRSIDAARYAESNLQRNAKVIEVADDQSNSLRDQIVVRGAPEKKCTPSKVGDPCKGEIKVDVIPGVENTITVVAFNRDNTIQSVPASVSFKSTLPKEEPHLWVLGVGIDQFAGISALKNARKDAQDFICTYAGKVQVSKIGGACAEDGKAKTLFKPQNIHVVDALFDAQATKSNILRALDKVAQQAKPGDTFVWFVASHGMMDANSNFGIVAHDTQCLNSNCTDIKGHLTSNDILEASKKIKAMKQLVVLDTCHAGGFDSKLSGLYDARVSLLAKSMGLHLYASAQATESAQDGKPGTNGTFTAQLLEGIKGAAPKNSEGQISVMTLGQYAKQKTIEVTQPKSGAKNALPAQTPVIQHFGQDAGLVGRLH